MPVEHGEYDNGPSLSSGGLVADHRDAWLILDGDHPTDGEIDLSAVDAEPGRTRLHTRHPDEDTIAYTDMVFDQFHLARLAFGLWERCGPFDQPEGTAVPIEVATTGQEAIAAYLRLGNGYPRNREYVAEKMGVTEQTVSNYCNRVRWTP